MPAISEKFLRGGSPSLHYAEGPDHGPPMVLLHGVIRRWQDFLPILPALGFRWRVHAVDLRGHGRSGRAPAGGYRAVDYVADIVAFLEHTRSEPAVILGHSLGAMVAAAVAAVAPGLVKAVVLEDPPFAMMGGRIAETSYLDLFLGYQEFAGSGRPVAEVAAALAEIRVKPPDRPDPVRLGDVRDAAALRFMASCLRQIDPAVLAPIVEGRWLDGYDVIETLRKVACPTLLLQADSAAGGALPDDYADEVASAIPDVIHIRLPGVGHQIHGSQPEAMLRLMTGFLESLD